MKKYIVLILFSVFFLFSGLKPAHATHYMGGEITWTCTPSGDFKFTMKLYRECYTSGGGQAANYGATEILTTTAPGFPSIQMTRISITDLSPQCGCPGGPTLFCPGMPSGAANMGALQEHVYTSDASFPNGVPLTGTPPVTGWSFSNASCCRNSSANIPGQPGWWIRAMMYPYDNLPVQSCFDSSPSFNERPSTVICTGYPYTYNHLASDGDMDSLAYEWAQPYSAANTPIATYSSGYSFNSPLPGPVHNPNNVAATIDPKTGIVSFTSYTNGAFVIVTKVTSFKEGVKVAEVFREMQVVLLDCGLNQPPVLTLPLQVDPGNPNWYIDTVYAGSTITFPLLILDLGRCNGTTGQAQTLHFSASGLMLDSLINPGGIFNPSGCYFPPCAGFSPSPMSGNPLSDTISIATQFTWSPGLQHLSSTTGSILKPRTHYFYLRAWDDFCPAPAIRNVVVALVVMPPVEDPQPKVRCLSVVPNGDVILHWTPPTAPAGWITGFQVDYSLSSGGPYTTVGSVNNPSATQFAHTGAGANLSNLFYRVSAQYQSPIPGVLVPSAESRIIRLTAQTLNPSLNSVYLSWTSNQTSGSPGYTGIYELYRETSPNQWTLINTTPYLHCGDSISYQGQYVRYKVTSANTYSDPLMGIAPCYSESNIVQVLLNDIGENPPDQYGVRISPNPGSGLFTFDPGSLQGITVLKIMDVSGKEVFCDEIFLQPGEAVPLDARHLTSGVYLLCIQNALVQLTIRLVMEP